MIVECVPNFSGPVERIAAAIAALPGVHLLDHTFDADHNRGVVTFAGPPDAVTAAAVASAGLAAELFDLRQHTGVHPRIGAIDVLPFVPVRDATLEDCARLAVRAAERIWTEHRIPAYLYEAAARRESCRNLADVRKYAASIPPDIGGPAHHPTAGAVAVGARKFLIAYNVNLRTAEVSVARAIARRIREADGGLPRVKALGLSLASRGIAQVSMNLTDFEVTPIAAAFEAVEREAARLGVEVLESELIGLAPQAALDADIAARVRLRGFSPDRILENRLPPQPGDAHNRPSFEPKSRGRG